MDKYFDLNLRVLAVYVGFDIGSHIEKMKRKHTKWSERQCACCLYWQNGVRKRLRQEVAYYITNHGLFNGYEVASTDCPEAMGVDVTATMKIAGLILEWPPKKIAYKIAFIGTVQPLVGRRMPSQKTLFNEEIINE